MRTPLSSPHKQPAPIAAKHRQEGMPTQLQTGGEHRGAQGNRRARGEIDPAGDNDHGHPKRRHADHRRGDRNGLHVPLGEKRGPGTP